MKLSKKICLFLGLFSFSVFGAFAQQKNIKDYVNPDYYDALLKNGMVRIIHEMNDESLQLVLNNKYQQDVINETVAKKKDNFPFVTESLYLLSKEEILKGKEHRNLDIKDVSRVLRSYSKMEGMKYYSLNFKKEQLLYKNAYTMENPENRKRVPDQIEGNADGNTYYCFQNDNSFGKVLYSVRCKENGDSFYALFENLDGMGVAFVKAIQPGDFKIKVVVEDVGDYFLLYMATDSDCIKMINIRKTMENSLMARMDALKKWFFNQF